MKYKISSPMIQPDVEREDSRLSADSVEGIDSTGQLISMMRLLWSKRGFLARVALWGLLASGLVAFLIPPRYKSTTRLMPPDNDSSSSSSLAMAAAAMSDKMGALADTAGSFLGLKKSSDVFVGILSSRTVQDKLINQFQLKKVYWDRGMQEAREDLAKKTSISVDRKTQIIEISVTDASPQRAAAMADAYVAELNRLVAELSTSSARRERIFLEGRLKEVSSDLEAAEKEFGQFASKNTAIDIKEQGKAMFDAAASVQGELIAAESELEGLRQIYNDNSVRVKAVRARISELRLQLEKLGGQDESSARASDQQGKSFYPSIRKLPVLGIEYADLYRRTKVEEAVFETLTRQYEMAKVQEAKEIPTVKVLDPADIPERRSFPSRVLIVSLGTAFSVLFAAAWILGSRRWKQTDPRQPGKQFATEIWAEISDRMPWGARLSHSRQNGRGIWNGLDHEKQGADEGNRNPQGVGRLP